MRRLTRQELFELESIQMHDLLDWALHDRLPAFERLPLFGSDASPMVRGWSHILAAYPKVGKSEFITQHVCEWAMPALYITEESALVWGPRLARLHEAGVAVPHDVTLYFGLGKTRMELGQVIQHSAEELLVIDTVRLLGIEDENDNALVGRILAPVIDNCRLRGRTLFMLHHSRKPRDSFGVDHGESIAGAHAFMGIVDVALILQHHRIPTRRVLRAFGRIDTTASYEYELWDGKLVLVNDETDEEGKAVPWTGRVLDVLSPDEWVATHEVMKRLGDSAKKQTVHRALKRQAEKGLVERYPPLGEDAERHTVQWRLAPKEERHDH